MKSFLSFVAVCALACTLTGCNNNKTDTASPGAVGEKKSECCAEKASMGAVGEKKSGCCSEASKTNGASMGAVSEKKEGGCCSSKSKEAGASMGAVSEKKSCTGVCPVTGKPIS
jgi:hypothetical protein